MPPLDTIQTKFTASGCGNSAALGTGAAARSLDDLHPELKPLCEQWLARCAEQSVRAEVICTYRSVADQNAAYAVGRDANGKVVGRTITKAKGGRSKHNVTLPGGTPASRAFDFTILNADGTCNWNLASSEWKAAVAAGKGLGLVWGGDFPNNQRDCDHFELNG